MSSLKEKKKKRNDGQQKGACADSKTGVQTKSSSESAQWYSDEPADNDFLCDLTSSLIETEETNAEKCLNTVGDIKEKIGKLEEELKEQCRLTSRSISKEKDSEIYKLNETVIYLSKELAESKRARSALENKIKLLETRKIELKSRLKRSETELKEFKQMFQTKEQKLIDEIKYPKGGNDTLEICKITIKDQFEMENSEIKEMTRTAEKSLDQKVKKLQDENSDLRYRLTKIAGSKMTDCTPDIVDLGDPNRPTQFGVEFSEFYDNEWTDAMEELEGSSDEKTNITTLRNIVEKAYKFGKTRSGTFMKELEKSVLSLSSSIQITPAIAKRLKEIRKEIATLVTDAIYQAFMDSHTEFKLGGDHLKSFIKKAVGLSWLMAIQDPPVVMSTKASEWFDDYMFKYYTKSGESVDYVVWPVVYLHEGGPIICKGVAQGK